MVNEIFPIKLPMFIIEPSHDICSIVTESNGEFSDSKTNMVGDNQPVAQPCAADMRFTVYF